MMRLVMSWLLPIARRCVYRFPALRTFKYLRNRQRTVQLFGVTVPCREDAIRNILPGPVSTLMDKIGTTDSRGC